MSGAWRLLDIASHPAGWEVRRISDLVRLTNGYPFNSDDFGSEGTPLVRIRDLLLDEYETYVNAPVPHAVMLQNGDVVIGMDGDFELTVWRRGPAALNQRMCLLRARPGIDARFVAYALPRHLKILNDLTYATTVKHLSSFQVMAERVAMPPESQQRAIADYLDAETARIDSLVDARRRQVELLARRIASLSRETTNVPSWPRVAVRRVFSVVPGATPASNDPGHWGGEIVWVTPQDLSAGEGLISTSSRSITAAGYRSCGTTLIPPDSLVLSTRAPIGSVRIAGAPLCTNQGCKSLVPTTDVNPWFMYFTLAAAADELQSLGQGSTFPELSTEGLREFRVPFPPMHVQKRVASELRTKTEHTRVAQAALSRQIDLLLERRQALITAAVTGQLEIPGVAA